MQVMLRLSDEIGRRLKTAVPARKRSAYVEALLRDALPPEDKDAWLARVAAEVQAEIDANPQLAEEERVWLDAPGDGWDDLPPFDFTDTKLERP